MARKSWAVVGLLFLIALINYFDRQSLSVVAPLLQADLHLSDAGYSHIVSLFLIASGISYAGAGYVTDWLGTRRAMGLFVAWWSVAEALTSLATNGVMLGFTRFCLGLGEPGLWVAAPKAAGELFPPRQRSIAIGVYTMGATAGAVLAIPIITLVTSHWKYRSIFWIDGLAGALWLPLWFWCFPKDRSPKVEVAQVAASPGILSNPLTWKLMVARGLTDPVWYFLLFWFPKYLHSSRALDASQLAHIGWLVYLAAGVGTLAGGSLVSIFIGKGISAGNAHKYSMLAAALIVPLGPLAAFAPTALQSIAIASVVAFAHMAWLVTLTGTVVLLYPAQSVGRAMGWIAAGSAAGGTISTELIGHFVAHSGYTPVFMAMGFLHPLAIAILWNSFHTSRKLTLVPQTFTP
jgi:ACS family hexuronate transporter-like MFS transporter